MGTTLEEGRAQVASYREARRGLAGARDDEWLAGYTGTLADGRYMYGTFTKPEPGAPMLVRFTDGQKWSEMMAVQRALPGLYVNCLCGTTIEWEDALVLVYSAVSRIGAVWQFAAIGGTEGDGP
jgi:hypothetical protein